MNGIATEQTQGVVSRAQFGQTLSISHPLRKLTISGEIWHFSQPFEHSNALGNLWAVKLLPAAVRGNLSTRSPRSSRSRRTQVPGGAKGRLSVSAPQLELPREDIRGENRERGNGCP